MIYTLKPLYTASCLNPFFSNAVISIFMEFLNVLPHHEIKGTGEIQETIREVLETLHGLFMAFQTSSLVNGTGQQFVENIMQPEDIRVGLKRFPFVSEMEKKDVFFIYRLHITIILHK